MGYCNSCGVAARVCCLLLVLLDLIYGDTIFIFGDFFFVVLSLAC